MPLKRVSLDSILDGFTETRYLSSKGSFKTSIGIDPDLALNAADYKTSGVIVPAQYVKTSSTELDDVPNWIVTTPKDSKVYVYTQAGDFLSYDNGLSGETLEGTISNSFGNGMTYYNNYIYLAGNTQIARFGPLDGTPSLTEEVWIGATLGSQTAITNVTYPAIRGAVTPNHSMHVHGDGALYVCDMLNGQGVIHKIKTKKGTDEGDTNDNSLYNALDLPFGFMPIDLESYGVDLVILAIQTTNTVLNQGMAALFFWDTIEDSFYRGPIFLPDPMATALLNHNGTLRIWSGNVTQGVRVSKYIGGETISDRDSDSVFLEDSVPPFPGAVDSIGGRIVWGGFTSYPETSACVWSLGSKNSHIPMGLHNIIRATSIGDNPLVSTLKYAQQADYANPKLAVGWTDDSDDGLDKQQINSATDVNSVLQTKIYTVGQRFQVQEIHIPLGKSVSGNMSITPTVYLDDEANSVTLRTINNTNYPSQTKVVYRKPELSHLIGENNFFIQFDHDGSTALPQILPVNILLETFGEELSP